MKSAVVAKKLHQFQDHFAVFKVVKDDGFYWVIVRVNGFCHFFLFVTFVVLIVDHFVERGDKPFELQKQDSHVFRKTGTFL